MEVAGGSAADPAGQSAVVPQASYHIEVSSADGASPPAEQPALSEVLPPHSGGGSGARSVVLVRRGSGPATPAGDGRSVKYVLTGLPAGQNGVGATPVKSPATTIPGQTTSASRARQILKKRLDLSLAEKKYTKLLHPESAADGDAAGEPQSAPTPVMICEPESDGAQKQGRTFFFVAKPPGETDVKTEEEEEGVATEGGTGMPLLPDGPARAAELPADQGVLKRLAKYRLSERYEILPVASLEDAEDVVHRLRMQNLALKTEMVRQATEYERHGDEYGLRARRGRKKATTIVALDRLRELEKIEAGMHSLFTPSQVKALSRDYKKNSVQWRDEDFRRALGLLENTSLRAFNYVRKEMNMPLPSLGTLKLRCPQQPELHVRLEAALHEGGAEARCKHCSRRVSATAASQGAAGDGTEAEYQQQLQSMHQQDQQAEWSEDPTPTRGVMKRKRPKGGAAARKAPRADDEVVFFEAPPASRARARRGGGRTGGAGGRGRPGLVAQYEQQQQQQHQDEDDDDDDDDEQEEDDAEDFAEDFGEEVEEEEVEIDPQQQEVPVQFAQFRSPYGAGWSEWDPRQLQ